MNYAAQLDFKRTLVANCLKKIGGIEFEVAPTVPSSKQYSYRNKLSLPVGRDANGVNVIGFYAQHSHRIVPIKNCPLQQEWAATLIDAVTKFMRKCKLSGFNYEQGGDVRHIVARQIEDKFIITLVATKNISLKELENILNGCFKKYTLLLNVNNTTGNVIFGNEWHICHGNGFFEGEDLGIKFKAGANTFLQVNDDVRTNLYNAVIKFADKKSVAIDLYSGGGMLTAMLAKNCKAAYGIEIVKEAVVCADELKEMNNLQAKMFNICGAVEDKIGDVLSANEGRTKLVVCDPPRKGMERSVVQAIIASKAEKVVLISCNPATLARDLGLLCDTLKEENGQLVKSNGQSAAYSITSITPYDMFPQTKHVETLVVLDRK
jgi:23S rRNA (uracil1939-C5)-methyltransferase